MDAVKVLGIVGSPRRKGNTYLLVEKALEGVNTVSGVSTSIYEIAGKKIQHCIDCGKCMEKEKCVFSDDFEEFMNEYMSADGIIWGTPVYHMSIPSLLKAAIDRLGNVTAAKSLFKKVNIPRFCKVCGILADGFDRFGGQELAMSYLVHSSILMNGIVVSGDTFAGSYIGAPAVTGHSVGGEFRKKDNVLKDSGGMIMAKSVGIRVAEMTKIVRAGIAALKKELPADYLTILVDKNTLR